LGKHRELRVLISGTWNLIFGSKHSNTGIKGQYSLGPLGHTHSWFLNSYLMIICFPNLTRSGYSTVLWKYYATSSAMWDSALCLDALMVGVSCAAFFSSLKYSFLLLWENAKAVESGYWGDNYFITCPRSKSFQQCCSVIYPRGVYEEKSISSG